MDKIPSRVILPQKSTNWMKLDTQQNIKLKKVAIHWPRLRKWGLLIRFRNRNNKLSNLDRFLYKDWLSKSRHSKDNHCQLSIHFHLDQEQQHLTSRMSINWCSLKLLQSTVRLKMTKQQRNLSLELNNYYAKLSKIHSKICHQRNANHKTNFN